MYRTAVFPSYWTLRLARGVLLDPAGLVRKLAEVQQFCGVERDGVGVAELVVGALVLPVGDALVGGARAGGLQARRLRRVAQREKHQRDEQHRPQRREEPLPADQRVPADRPADHLRQRGADGVGAAGQVAVVEAPPVVRQRPAISRLPARRGRAGDPSTARRAVTARLVVPVYGVGHGGGGGAPAAPPAADGGTGCDGHGRSDGHGGRRAPRDRDAGRHLDRRLDHGLRRRRRHSAAGSTAAAAPAAHRRSRRSPPASGTSRYRCPPARRPSSPSRCPTAGPNRRPATRNCSPAVWCLRWCRPRPPSTTTG